LGNEGDKSNVGHGNNVDDGRGRKDVVARAARAARAAREDKSAGANFGNLSVLGETDLLQLISINGLMGVGVPRCWCSLVTKGKNSTSNITLDSAETSTKNHDFCKGFGTIGGTIQGTIE
jgi:hypothetical protein